MKRFKVTYLGKVSYRMAWSMADAMDSFFDGDLQAQNCSTPDYGKGILYGPAGQPIQFEHVILDREEFSELYGNKAQGYRVYNRFVVGLPVMDVQALILLS